MTDTAVIDLRDRKNPPPDDPINAPYGFRWDTRSREWQAKRSAGGRKSGTAWFGKNAEPETAENAAVTEERADADPAPSYMAKPVKPVRKTPPKVTKQVKDDIEGALGLIGVIMMPISQADPYCGQVLATQYPKIAEALVPLLCKSPAVVAFMTSGDGSWMLWIQLLIATAPVAMAFGRHHILKTVELETDDQGNVYAVEKDFSDYAAV